MNSWLDPLRDALDQLDDPVARSTVFFRDDDVGWDERGLLALVEVFARHGVALDLAVIPAAADPRIAGELLHRRRAAPIGLHQHGYAHTNHELDGRKCEFGPTRTLDEMAADVSSGTGLLTELFGDAVDPIFTPPWNRCRPELADVLIAAGFEVLSRDSTAKPSERSELVELPITVNWFGRSRGTKLPWNREQRAVALADAIASRQPVGIMLHHAVCDADDRADVDDLVGLLANHPHVACASMMEIAGA